MAGTPELFASEQTLKNFPILQEPQKLLSGSVLRAYVIAPEDIITPENEMEAKWERDFIEKRVTAFQYNQFKEQHGTYKTPEILRAHLDTLYPELSEAVTDDEINELSQLILQGAPCAMKADSDISNPEMDMGVVVMSYADRTKEDLAAMFAHTNRQDLQNLPGTDSMWHEAIIAHEFGHINQSANRYGLAEEIGADKNISVGLKDRFQATEFRTFMDAFQGVRALAFLTSDNDHMVHASIRSSHEGYAPKISERQYTAQLSAVKDIIAHSRGMSLVSAGEYLKVVNCMLHGVEPYTGIGIVAVDTREKEILEQMLANPEAMFSEGDDGLAPYERLNEDTKKAFLDSVYNIDRDAGNLVIFHNKKALYQHARDCYQNGEFDKNPVGKQFVYEFLEAAKAYAPDVYGADPAEFFHPPVFDETGAAANLEKPLQLLVKP